MRSLAVTAIGALCVVSASSSVSAARPIDPDLREIINRPRLLEEAIRADVRFRRSLHFRADRDYVRSLYRNPGRTVGTRSAGVLLTPRESAEFEARQALDADITIILDAVDANAELRERFGGVAIDNETGELAVMLKDGAPRGWLTDVPHPDRVSIRHADLSETELLALKKRITSAWEADEAGTGSITGLALDTLANAIWVDFHPDAVAGLAAGRFPAAFESRFDTSHLLRGVSTGAQAVADDLVAGGWSWAHSTLDNTYRCTVGFAVEKAGSGDDFVVTAGHCVHPGENWDPVFHHYGGTEPPEGEIGVITPSHVFEGGSIDMDAALLRIDATTPTFGTEARVVHESSGTPYALVVIGKVGSQAQGQTRCFTGKKTGGTKCGEITSSSATSRYGVKDEDGNVIIPEETIDNLVQISVRPDKGDSGGPAYRRLTGQPQPNTVEAAGMMVSRDNDQVQGYYVKIQEALDWISGDAEATVTLKKWVDAPGCTPLTACPQDDGGDY